jgi:hypothetical protein
MAVLRCRTATRSNMFGGKSLKRLRSKSMDSSIWLAAIPWNTRGLQHSARA